MGIPVVVVRHEFLGKRNVIDNAIRRRQKQRPNVPSLRGVERSMLLARKIWTPLRSTRQFCIAI